MTYSFNPKHGPILVDAEISGPVGSLKLSMILDTGATTSVIKEAVLVALGFDLSDSSDRVMMTTGTTVTSVPRVGLTRLTSLGHHHIGIRVLAHTLPPMVTASGLLGLDFLRDLQLAIDFRSGQISLV